MDGRCMTCRHFLPHREDRVRFATDLAFHFDGFCEEAEMPTTEYDDATDRWHWDRDPSPMLASSIDGSGYRGSLLVKRTFGCVCWAPKEAV